MRTSLYYPLRLTILKTFRKLWKGQMRWFYLCQCACGTTKEIYKYSVDYGLTRSCGCLHREVQPERGRKTRTHGDSGHNNKIAGGRTNEAPEYNAWRSMMKRCYDPKHDSYPSHGGRGITVCQEWRDAYEPFLAHVGRRPTAKHSLDRCPDNNGNYEPGNVRWATWEEQARNRRDNVLLTWGEKTQCASAWAEDLGFNDRHTIYARLKMGWSVERTLTTPPRKRRNKMAWGDLPEG
jgi:hypothetical protein